MGRRNGRAGRPEAIVGLLLAVGLGCASAPDTSETPGAALPHAAPGDDLARAVARYQNDGELESLRSWLEDHPEDPDAEYWSEIVALRLYESLALGDPFADPHPEAGDDPALEPLPEPSVAQLGMLAAAYPRTVAGRTAAAHLDFESLRQLREPRLSQRAARFLAGDDASLHPSSVDPVAFRARHEESLRRGFVDALVRTGCATAMGYCTWWVATFPADPATPQIARSASAVWKQRAHPPWRSKGYATCALRCARTCRAQALPFDDACYDPCFARC